MWRGFSFNLNLQIQMCVYGGIIFDIIYCFEGANFEQSYDFLWNLVLKKLDRGRVNCGTIILRGRWLFGQNEI